LELQQLIKSNEQTLSEGKVSFDIGVKILTEGNDRVEMYSDLYAIITVTPSIEHKDCLEPGDKIIALQHLVTIIFDMNGKRLVTLDRNPELDLQGVYTSLVHIPGTDKILSINEGQSYVTMSDLQCNIIRRFGVLDNPYRIMFLGDNIR
jgi:hypothetical protein